MSIAYHELTCVICGKSFLNLSTSVMTCNKQCTREYRNSGYGKVALKAEEAALKIEEEKISALNKMTPDELVTW